MNNYGIQSGNKNINPFEMGTNEYNQSQTTPQLNSASYTNGFISPVADFSYARDAEVPSLATISYNNAPSESFNNSTIKSLSFGANGQDFLTFNQPPEWYVKEISLRAIQETDQANGLEQVVGLELNNKQATELNSLEPDLYANTKIDPEQENLAKGVYQGTKKIIESTSGVLKKVFKESVYAFKSLFSLFFESFLGFGSENKKPLTKEEKEQKEKEAKRNENKKKFWENLASLSKPVQIIGVVKQEMIITNQHNGFYEEYKGVVTSDAKITEYHRANRAKKESENKAHQIQAQRSAKIAKAGAGKKPTGMPTNRAGELLMGTENPSHFTKALG